MSTVGTKAVSDVIDSESGRRVGSSKVGHITIFC